MMDGVGVVCVVIVVTPLRIVAKEFTGIVSCSNSGRNERFSVFSKIDDLDEAKHCRLEAISGLHNLMKISLTLKVTRGHNREFNLNFSQLNLRTGINTVKRKDSNLN